MTKKSLRHHRESLSEKIVKNQSKFCCFVFFVICLKYRALVDRVDDCVAVGKRANFHASVHSAREHPAELVDLDLRHALSHVLEEAAVFVLAGVEEERRTHGGAEGPNLLKIWVSF